MEISDKCAQKLFMRRCAYERKICGFNRDFWWCSSDYFKYILYPFLLWMFLICDQWSLIYIAFSANLSVCLHARPPPWSRRSSNRLLDCASVIFFYFSFCRCYLHITFAHTHMKLYCKRWRQHDIFIHQNPPNAELSSSCRAMKFIKGQRNRQTNDLFAEWGISKGKRN